MISNGVLNFHGLSQWLSISDTPLKSVPGRLLVPLSTRPPVVEQEESADLPRDATPGGLSDSKTHDSYGPFAVFRLGRFRLIC